MSADSALSDARSDARADDDCLRCGHPMVRVGNDPRGGQNAKWCSNSCRVAAKYEGHPAAGRDSLSRIEFERLRKWFKEHA